MKNKNAFTLAEVLITMAVIGIVAALTIPSLIQNHKKQEYSSKLKKFYSTMQNAIRLSELDNGQSSSWEVLGFVYNDDESKDWNTTEENNYKFFMKYLANYLKYNKIERGSVVDGGCPEEECGNNWHDGEKLINPMKVYLADGTTMIWGNGAVIDLIFDVNGDLPPNIEGRDRFRFLFDANLNPPCSGSVFGMYYPCSEYTTREKALEGCKSNGGVCTALFKYDNFEFKDDYPYKL